MPSGDVIGDIVLYDLDLLFEGQISNWQYFGSSFVIISQTIGDVVQVPILPLNGKSRVSFKITRHICILNLTHSETEGQDHAHFYSDNLGNS